MKVDEVSTEAAQKPTTRRRFIRQLGMTLAAAVGAGVLAKSAFAVEGDCCRDCGCGSCAGGCYCRCDCGAGGTYCYTVIAGCIQSGDSACGHLCPC